LPVIGCVAGPHCDGTVVVMHDILGYTAGHPPRSVKQYANLQATLTGAFRAFVEDVRGARFHGDDGGISMPAEELARLQAWLRADAPEAAALSRMP
jgi:3-methyl-2-oxobutanoate hydroxymethyltransferase